MIRLDRASFGCYVITKVDSGGDETGNDIFVQSDWDFPAIASCFGFVPCECGMTDGTIDCAHHTVSEMISAARDYLDDHIGDIADDPGYFDS